MTKEVAVVIPAVTPGQTVTLGSTYASFDQMCWPRIGGEALEEVQWRLHYGEPTKQDLMHAAQIMASYRALAWKTRRDRDAVIRQLRAVEVG